MLINFLIHPLNKNLLTNSKKVFDSLINEKAFGVKKEDTFDEKKLLRLETSVIAEARFVRDLAVLGVSETPIDVLSDWLDTLGLDCVNSVDDSNILWVTLDMMVLGAEDKKTKTALYYFHRKSKRPCVALIILCKAGKSQYKYFNFSSNFWLSSVLSRRILQQPPTNSITYTL